MIGVPSAHSWLAGHFCVSPDPLVYGTHSAVGMPVDSRNDQAHSGSEPHVHPRLSFSHPSRSPGDSVTLTAPSDAMQRRSLSVSEAANAQQLPHWPWSSTAWMHPGHSSRPSKDSGTSRTTTARAFASVLLSGMRSSQVRCCSNKG